MDITINYWAVLVAGLAYLAIGALWYGPLFGKYWMKLMGFTPDQMKGKMANGMTAGKAMALGLIAALVMANVLAHEAYVWGEFAIGMTSFMLALNLSFWLWLGFIATTQLGSVLWEGRPWKLFFLNTAHAFVSLLAMACILVFWA